MTSDRAKLSLWLVPAEPGAAALQAVLDELARSTASPWFPPHVTLCSFAAHHPPAIGAELELPRVAHLSAPRFGLDYFQACYLPLSDDEGEFRALQRASGAAWGGRVNESYPPHLSLAYGSLTSAQQDLARRLADSAPPFVPLSHWEVWRTEGPVSTWCKLARG